jgi:acetylornithine deacetylase/succinyl-diaminopimelate desuccinylase-like protein
VTEFAAFDAFVSGHRDAWLAELIDLARPSVSATGEGIAEMGPRVVARLRAAGATADLVESGVSHPAVIGEIGAGRRSVLFYDHYDVQPPGDPATWSTPPWQPTLKDGRLFGRGVADDKGELLARIHAVEAWQATNGPLPLKVRYLIEGAHEIGSPGLAEIVNGNRDRLVADACLSEGTGRDEQGNVTINLGCRGFVSVELRVALRSRTLASMYGGLLASAPRLLLDAVASVVGPDGALLVDGADERVQTGTPDDLALLERIPWDEDEIRRTLDVADFAGGMSGDALRRRYVLEPFVAVCTFTSGDPSWGLFIIPGEAAARLDIRLVPGLDPDVVVDLLRRHLEAHGYGKVSVTVLAAVAPDRCDPAEPVVAAAIEAARDAEGRDPVVYPLMPAYSASRVFRDGLGTPVLFAGAVTNASSNLHASNENIVIDEYAAYVRFLGRFLDRFARA